MKKLLLGLGAVVAVAAPVASVVACGDSTKEFTVNITGKDLAGIQSQMTDLMKTIKGTNHGSATGVKVTLIDGDEKTVASMSAGGDVEAKAKKYLKDVLTFFKTAYTTRGLTDAANAVDTMLNAYL